MITPNKCIYRVWMGFCLLLKGCKCEQKDIEFNPFKQMCGIYESDKK